MKMFVAVLLSALTVQGHAQRLLTGLENHQKEIEPKPNTTNPTQKPDVKVDPVVKVKSSGDCKEVDMSSIPLSYITSLIQEKDGRIDVTYKPGAGTVTITTPNMIGNCSSMIEWVPNARVVDGKKVYSIEAKIKKTDDCTPTEGCTYNVDKIDREKVEISHEDMKFKPTLAGFESCLEKTGVIQNGKVVNNNISEKAVNETFDGFKETGELLFMSSGPVSKFMKPKYSDKFVEIDNCNHYEKISPEGLYLKSLEDEESDRLAAEKAEIAKCGEYDKISDFMKRYQGYADDLNQIRDSLIIEAVKKASKNIADGKYSEEDLKALADFETYILNPKINFVDALYKEAEGLEGTEKTARLAQIKAIMTELAGYMNKPMISPAVVQKLEDNGDFDGAALANGMRALVVSHARLGAKEGGVIITPEVAKIRTDNLKQAYAKELAEKKEIYDVRTGQDFTKSKENLDKATQRQKNIDMRTRNFSNSIAIEYARIQQPNGYCYRSPFRNVQNCVQKSMAEIQRLQAEMTQYNQMDAQYGQDYLKKAEMYSKLEKEGRDYIARQNGEAPEQDDSHTNPTANNQGYNFDFQGYTTQLQQQYMQQSTQPQQQQGNMFNMQNPYSQQQQQGYNPYQQQQQQQMGGQLYGQFGFGNQNQYGYNNQQYNPYMQQNPYAQQQQYYQQPYQQYNPYQTSMFGQQYQASNPFMGQQQSYMPQQQGYWQNPYQAYGQYNMWAR